MGFDKAYGTTFWTTRGAALGNVTNRNGLAGRLSRGGFIPRGMGDYVCDESGCYDTGTGTGSSSGGGSTTTTLQIPGQGPIGTSGGAASSPAFNWGGLVNNLSNDFTKIYKAIQPTGTGCTQYTGPNGVSYVSCSGTQQAPGVSIPGIPGLSSMSTTTLLALAAAAIAVIAIASGGK